MVGRSRKRWAGDRPPAGPARGQRIMKGMRMAPRRAFAAADGAMARRRGGAAVAEENHHGVVFELEALERRKDSPDGIIHGGEHGGEIFSHGADDVGEAVEIFLRRRIGRGVNGVERQIEEERIFTVPLDEADGFCAESVGEIAAVFDGFIVVPERVALVGGFLVVGP